MSWSSSISLWISSARLALADHQLRLDAATPWPLAAHVERRVGLLARLARMIFSTPSQCWKSPGLDDIEQHQHAAGALGAPRGKGTARSHSGVSSMTPGISAMAGLAAEAFELIACLARAAMLDDADRPPQSCATRCTRPAASGVSARPRHQRSAPHKADDLPTGFMVRLASAGALAAVAQHRVDIAGVGEDAAHLAGDRRQLATARSPSAGLKTENCGPPKSLQHSAWSCRRARHRCRRGFRPPAGLRARRPRSAAAPGRSWPCGSSSRSCRHRR